MTRATEIGGRVSSGSGSSWRDPQDVKNDTHLEQLKYTDHASYSLKVREWIGLRNDADRAGRIPRMVIDFEREGVRLIVTEEVR